MKTCDKCGSTEFNKYGNCKPCKKAYLATYHIANSENIKKQRAEYYQTNAEKIKAHVAEYRAANPELIKERDAAFRKANPDKRKKQHKNYREANPEKVKAQGDAWRKVNRPRVNANYYAWCAANPDRKKEIDALWNAKNPESRRTRCINRRARRLEAGGSFTKEDVKALLKSQKGKCVVCRDDISLSYHIDHIMPLSLGGSNGKENIQLLCPHCNLVKGAKHPTDFMQSRGFLI